MLQLQNLKASINDKFILNGLNLDIKPGEVHAIMLSLIHISEPTRPY